MGLLQFFLCDQPVHAVRLLTPGYLLNQTCIAVGTVLLLTSIGEHTIGPLSLISSIILVRASVPFEVITRARRRDQDQDSAYKSKNAAMIIFCVCRV